MDFYMKPQAHSFPLKGCKPPHAISVCPHHGVLSIHVRTLAAPLDHPRVAVHLEDVYLSYLEPPSSEYPNSLYTIECKNTVDNNFKLLAAFRKEAGKAADFPVHRVCNHRCSPVDKSQRRRSVEAMKKALPSALDAKVECPARCHHHAPSSVWTMVQYLNDDHRWTREEIADWLDKVSEEQNIDLSFPIPEGEVPE